jgi:hypothetical protein
MCSPAAILSFGRLTLLRFAPTDSFKTGITRVLALGSGWSCHHETNKF